MGRGKKKRKANRIAKMKRRISIRKQMGKPVYFTLTHCNNKLNGIANRYNYKANMHKLIYAGARFYNVKYQASIITDCNFKDAKLIGVDFFNCNMQRVSFKNAYLENVVFYNCNLKKAQFDGTRFKNVVFICTNMDVAQNLNFDEITVLRTYKKLDLPVELESNLLDLANNNSIYEAKVLHVNKKKLNHWVLRIIQERYGLEALIFMVKRLKKKEQWDNLYTVFSFLSLLENTLKR